jgi:hypothetical protein
MFEQWRIKPHMDVIDTAGLHVGTVDAVEQDRVKLTRQDSADGQHHFIDLADVDRIDGDKVLLKPGTVLAVASAAVPAQAAASEGRAADASSAANTFAANVSAAEIAASSDVSQPPSTDTPLFGTSGHGTGMGGSGSGN